MSRWVQPQREGLKSGGEEPPDSMLTRVVKLVPAEIVSPYTMLYGILASSDLAGQNTVPAVAGLMGLFFLVTIGYVWLRAPQGSPRTTHLIVSPLAFLAWAYPISGALLGSLFIGLIAFFLQAIVIALSILIQPRA